MPIIAALTWSTSAGATLVFENVINRVPGFGPSAISIPMYYPSFVNVLTGEHSFLANEPGEIDTVSIGFPRDEDLLTFSIWNNTAYNFTKLTLKIIGSSFQPDGQESWIITRDSKCRCLLWRCQWRWQSRAVRHFFHDHRLEWREDAHVLGRGDPGQQPFHRLRLHVHDRRSSVQSWGRYEFRRRACARARNLGRAAHRALLGLEPDAGPNDND